MMRRLFFLALIACAFTLASCTTPQTRISENPGIYNSLSATDQALVSRGEIREGMSQDAVFLAWGPPNQRGPGRNRGRATETWIYFGTTSGDYYPPLHAYGGFYGGYAYLHRHRSGRLHRHVYYDPFYDPWFYRRTSVVSYPERVVSFQNGRVIAFQYLPAPRFF